MMNRKADANMWWIIIGAVLALVVLIVLMVIFTGGTNKINKGLLDCQGKGGQCVGNIKGNTETTCVDGTTSSAFDCPVNEICCFGGKKS